MESQHISRDRRWYIPHVRRLRAVSPGVPLAAMRAKQSIPLRARLRARWQRTTVNVFWIANGLLAAAAAALLLALAVWNAVPWVRFLWLAIFLAVCAAVLHGAGYLAARREAERQRARRSARTEDDW